MGNIERWTHLNKTIVLKLAVNIQKMQRSNYHLVAEVVCLHMFVTCCASSKRCEHVFFLAVFTLGRFSPPFPSWEQLPLLLRGMPGVNHNLGLARSLRRLCAWHYVCVCGAPFLHFVPHFVSIASPSLTLAWSRVVDGVWVEWRRV